MHCHSYGCRPCEDWGPGDGGEPVAGGSGASGALVGACFGHALGLAGLNAIVAAVDVELALQSIDLINVMSVMLGAGNAAIPGDGDRFVCAAGDVVGASAVLVWAEALCKTMCDILFITGICLATVNSLPTVFCSPTVYCFSNDGVPTAVVLPGPTWPG